MRCRTLVDTDVLLLRTRSTLLLCSGPIEGCSTVLAVRRYGCGFQCSVCAFVVVCAEEEAGSKTKLRGCSCYSEAMASRADTALTASVCP